MRVTTIGLDIAKSAFQVHGADRHGRAVLKRKLTRSKVLVFFANLPPCRGRARRRHHPRPQRLQAGAWASNHCARADASQDDADRRCVAADQEGLT